MRPTDLKLWLVLYENVWLPWHHISIITNRFLRVRVRIDTHKDAMAFPTDIAEGFKQGAMTPEVSVLGKLRMAPCLKSLCAKPLAKASGYVF
jgi:hypothetical protein